MDRRKNYYLLIDTETCNGIMDGNKLDLSQSIVYDFGFQVIDKKGNVYKKGSYLIDETFNGMADLMNSCYYANKLPQYFEDIKNGSRIVKPLMYVRKVILNTCKEWNIKAIVAHNAYFDYRAMRNTVRYFTGSKFKSMFPYGVEWYDTLKMARDVIGIQKSYVVFCEENEYLTKYKKPRFTAEILYRYMTDNIEFEESHTALEDVEIETQIFARCMRQHKKMRKKLFKDREGA